MLRDASAEMIASRNSHNLVSRDFVLIAGRDRSDNTIHWLKVWSDINNPEVQVRDIETGGLTTHIFEGNGKLLSVDPITMVCEQQITVRNLTITLNILDDRVNDFVRGYDLHEQKVFVYQGDLVPGSYNLQAPPVCFFAGVVDTNPIITGAAGQQSSTVIDARSHNTELTRTNTLKGSHASEVLRDGNDTLMNDAAVVGTWLTYLGQATPKQASKV